MSALLSILTDNVRRTGSETTYVSMFEITEQLGFVNRRACGDLGMNFSTVLI